MGIPEAPDAPRRPKIIARRTKMASHWQGERSERASAASAASGAIEVFERLFFRIFREIHGNHRKEHDIAGETQITKRASRSLT